MLNGMSNRKRQTTNTIQQQQATADQKNPIFEQFKAEFYSHTKIEWVFKHYVKRKQ